MGDKGEEKKEVVRSVLEKKGRQDWSIGGERATAATRPQARACVPSSFGVGGVSRAPLSDLLSAGHLFWPVTFPRRLRHQSQQNRKSAPECPPRHPRHPQNQSGTCAYKRVWRSSGVPPDFSPANCCTLDWLAPAPKDKKWELVGSVRTVAFLHVSVAVLRLWLV